MSLKEVEENFKFAVNQVNSSKNDPTVPMFSDDEKLQFYALYKQATTGKCTTQQPYAFQFVESAKWKAWNSLGNMSKHSAMEKYCELYLDVSAKYGL
jgi:acyl-CoA-binding protein